VEHRTLNSSTSVQKEVPSRSLCASEVAISTSLAADCFSFFDLMFGRYLVGAILSLMFLTGRVAEFYSAGGVIYEGACLLLADFLLSGFSIVSSYPIRYVTDEEVTEFTANLDTLLELPAIQAKDPRKRKEARDKQRQLGEDGLHVSADVEAGLDNDLSDAEWQQKRRRKASKTSVGAMLERMQESRQEYEKKDKELAELEEKTHREVVGDVIELVE